MNANPQLAWDTAQPWLNVTQVGLMSAVNRLKARGDNEGIFALLVKAAASGDWDLFVTAMEQATSIRGVLGLLHTDAGAALESAYELASLPPKLFPLFVSVIRLGLAAREQVRGLRPSKRLRTIILDKAFNKPEVAALRIHEDLKVALYA